MTFTATYRDRTGAMHEERIEAESRDAAFAVMRARGIAPIGIKGLKGDKGFRGEKGKKFVHPAKRNRKRRNRPSFKGRGQPDFRKR